MGPVVAFINKRSKIFGEQSACINGIISVATTVRNMAFMYIGCTLELSTLLLWGYNFQLVLQLPHDNL